MTNFRFHIFYGTEIQRRLAYPIHNIDGYLSFNITNYLLKYMEERLKKYNLINNHYDSQFSFYE